MWNRVAFNHTRRTLLQAGSLGALGLTLPELLAARSDVAAGSPRAKLPDKDSNLGLSG